ncbi:Cadmium, cobalt and zinc/H(+)-K(+) antiporter [Marinomonas aquimarina]|uniref:Cadmium, cobalt and zinc/H(+)-K(+) antiporter n=1 Tax=Marinomonas aquimarina TaxID=295068 RepID=A0A1A8T5M8_9GAMM|nr:cation diffusion facilitator family transporter [Marinomonas aquimarina]SBS26292.1 Cadmium, cobalt and zinc/H(+)-K(+) antiporter [Marinomonas aquimarina]
MSKLQQEKQIAQRVTIVGAFWDAVLGIAKIIAGWLSQSQALIADGIHSLSDLVTDVFVVIASNNARQAPDKNHPYGHLRFETLTTVILGVILIVVATGIVFEAFNAETTPVATWYGVGAVILTIVVKEAIFHYTKRAGDQIGSKLLVANAWHSRSDALSSVAVLIGLIGVYFGYAWADKVASAVVGFFIGKIAVEMIWDNLKELVDTAPDPKTIEQIKETVSGLKNVMAPHDIRARSMAGKIFLDMHIHVPAHATVSEGHYLSDLVVYTIKKAHPQVQDVMVHVDTDDHIQSDTFEHEHSGRPPALQLPARDQILADLGFMLRTHRAYIDLELTQLHYLNKTLNIHIVARASQAPSTDLSKVTQSILFDLQNIPYGKEHKVLWLQD